MVLPIVDEARRCTVCAAELPHVPRPVLRIGANARVVIVGQAPGAKVHASGVPWDDASGEHLREWLAIDEATFVDPERVGILPMGLCWPGRRAGGDLPPRPECAPRWHPPVLEGLRRPPLLLLVGSYAIARYLGAEAKPTLTETVEAFGSYGPLRFPLPHPSWRSRAWRTKNPFFDREVLPALRWRVREALDA
ncbi:MAG: uracil-DNA glycosylase family protein [Sandaracinus sp.]|nr:uracil-DNA glycosylase family protein [Sandaracinus sp.]